MALRTISASLQKKAAKEIDENPKRLASDILAIRQWLQKQPHLQAVKPSDQWLVAFLRGCKFSLERSKEKLDMYYTLRAVVPEFFTNRDPMDKNIQEILKIGVFLPVRKLESETSPRVTIMRLGAYNPSQFHLADMIKISLMITEILMLEDDNLTIMGEDIIVDMKDVGINVLTQWTPALAKKVITCFEKALPVRIKGNHILNTPPGFETAYVLFKSFLGDKMKKRIQVHNENYKNMHKTIPKAVLPVEYGGEDGTLEQLRDYWKEKVENYREWFIKEESVRSDESKRPDMAKNSSNLFGIEGSFRKLEVD